jgi:hypothetical protein
MNWVTQGWGERVVQTRVGGRAFNMWRGDSERERRTKRLRE